MRFIGNYSVESFLQVPLQNNVLGALCFTVDDHDIQAINAQSEIPTLHVPIQRLGTTASVCECWSRLGEVQRGNLDDIYYQYDNEVLFGVVHIAESAFQRDDRQTPLQQATESAYSQIFALLKQLDFAYIFRFWNYIADINGETDELERYRQFNLGRHHAFVANNQDVTKHVPAACALGLKHAKKATLSIAFLAGKVKPIPIENPRQISAYKYPDKYGPVSPTFSRATLVQLKNSDLLLISGTASIVGHQTQHASDAVIQTKEAIINIKTVVDQVNLVVKNPIYHLDGLHFRVYVRYAEHVTKIHDELKRLVENIHFVEFFLADICRQDLLLEIEATMEIPSTVNDEMKG